MKTILTSPDQMVLDETPWDFALLFSAFGLVLPGVGMDLLLAGQFGLGLATIAFSLVVGAIHALVVRRTRVYLNRPLDLLEIRWRTTRGDGSQRYPLSNLRNATLQTMGGETWTRRLAFALDHGNEQQPATST